jgi:hypothetical protein
MVPRCTTAWPLNLARLSDSTTTSAPLEHSKRNMNMNSRTKHKLVLSVRRGFVTPTLELTEYRSRGNGKEKRGERLTDLDCRSAVDITCRRLCLDMSRPTILRPCSTLSQFRAMGSVNDFGCEARMESTVVAINTSCFRTHMVQTRQGKLITH